MSNAIVKNLSFGLDAKNNVFAGITKLTQAVSSTLGASGKCVILEDTAGKPIITKDGVTVAESVILLDPVENMGATLLKEAARKTVKEAGDGTTTATVLAHSILEEAYKLEKKFTSREIKQGILSTTQKVIDHLKENSIPVKGDMIDQVATISTNNDPGVGWPRAREVSPALATHCLIWARLPVKLAGTSVPRFSSSSCVWFCA